MTEWGWKGQVRRNLVDFKKKDDNQGFQRGAWRFFISAQAGLPKNMAPFEEQAFFLKVPPELLKVLCFYQRDLNMSCNTSA